MAEIVPTFKHYLQTLNPDAYIKYDGNRWRAADLLHSLSMSNSPQLAFTTVDAKGTLTFLNSGTADTTHTAETHKHG